MDINFNVLYQAARRLLQGYFIDIGLDKKVGNFDVRKWNIKAQLAMEKDKKNRPQNFNYNEVIKSMNEGKWAMCCHTWSNNTISIFHQSKKFFIRRDRLNKEYDIPLNIIKFIKYTFVHELVHACFNMWWFEDNWGSSSAYTSQRLVQEYIAHAIEHTLYDGDYFNDYIKIYHLSENSIKEKFFNSETLKPYDETSPPVFEYSAYHHYKNSDPLKIIEAILEQKEKWRPY